MRRVTLGSTGIETSCIGFGCASLGSRVSARDGLRALEEALDGGVTWIDVAPSYGAGQAETLIAPFLARHRDRVQVSTKVGLVSPRSGLTALMAPVARRAVSTFPALRNVLRRSGANTARPLPLTPEVLTGSLEASLRRLGTERVDLFSLHDADPEEIAREPVLRALEDILASGKARAVAVASSTGAAARTLEQGTPYRVIQFPLPEPGASTAVIAEATQAGFGCITHSIFGVDGALARLSGRLLAHPALRAELMERVGTDDHEAAVARLLLERAFALNPAGIVLVSMFSERSRRQNLAVAARSPAPDSIGLIEQLAA